LKEQVTQSIELARQEGEEFRSVQLSVSAAGARLGAQDIGSFVEQVWGREEYEFWVDVEGAAMPNLVFALLKEKFAGRSDAVEAFRDFCRLNGVPHKFDTWP
jgi:hypothetical protein